MSVLARPTYEYRCTACGAVHDIEMRPHQATPRLVGFCECSPRRPVVKERVVHLPRRGD